LVNKVDLPNNIEDEEEDDIINYDTFCKENGIICWFPISAINNTGINDAFQKMALCLTILAPTIETVPEPLQMPKPEPETKLETKSKPGCNPIPDSAREFAKIVKKILDPRNPNPTSEHNSKIDADDECIKNLYDAYFDLYYKWEEYKVSKDDDTVNMRKTILTILINDDLTSCTKRKKILAFLLKFGDAYY